MHRLYQPSGDYPADGQSRDLAEPDRCRVDHVVYQSDIASGDGADTEMMVITAE